MKNKIGDKSELKILFVNINPRPDWTKDKTEINFPLGLAKVMTSATNGGYTCELLDLMLNERSDEELFEIFSNGKYDVIAMGTLTHAYWQVKNIVDIAKKVDPKTCVIVGCYVSSTMPEKLLKWTKTDVAVIGEGVKTIVEVLDRIISGESFHGVLGITHRSNDEIIVEENRPALQNLDEIGQLKWDLFDIKAYVEASGKLKSHNFWSDKELHRFPANTTSGCPNRCTFCTNSKYYKYNPFRSHSPKYLITQFKYLINNYGVNHFRLFDELSFLSASQAAPFIDAILKAKLNVTFEGVTRIGFLKEGDLDFAKKMKEAGFVMLNTGMESANKEVLVAMNKKINPQWFGEQKRVLDKADILMTTNLVIGYPQETEKSIAESFNLCYENDIMPSIGFLLPAPGSVIYDYALEKNYIEDEETYLLNIGERQFMKINMTSMSEEIIYDLCLYHLKRIRDKLGLDIADEHLICSIVLEKEEAKSS